MLIRTDPFRQFDQYMERLFGTTRGVDGDGETETFAMPMDAYLEVDKYVAEFDLPGVDPESVDISVERNGITVTATRERSAPYGVEWVISERPREASFCRRFMISDSIDTDRIEAHFANGVLTLELPLRERMKPRHIQVAAGPETAAVVPATGGPAIEAGVAGEPDAPTQPNGAAKATRKRSTTRPTTQRSTTRRTGGKGGAAAK